jgi:hypothetical protein
VPGTPRARETRPVVPSRPRESSALASKRPLHEHSMPPPPAKLRKQYINTEYPNLVLRFEDGHEIVVKRGVGKTFDIYSGETVRLLAVFDPDARERELVATRKAEEFDNA